MNSRYRTRCMCIPDEKWWDVDNNLASTMLDEYIGQRARITAYNGECPNLMDLKKLPDIDNKNIEEIRITIQGDIPFKPILCKYMLMCCGMCDKICDRRCVQDMYNKLYFRIQRGDLVAETIKRTLSNPQLNYATLRDLYNSVFLRYWNDILKEELKDVKEPFKFNYAPQAMGKIDSIGRNWLEVDPTTGNARIMHWPTTGLCPYCMPRITGYNRGKGK